jgi:hypothetical protein
MRYETLMQMLVIRSLVRTEPNESPVIRTLRDDTLIVFLSDCHIGGSDGRDIFESPNDLIRLFAELDADPRPIELVLAGDFFD